jgi:chloride channel protein, CIC family
VLLLDRSALTEKIARRGLHVTRDYTTDPLETFFVANVMRPEPSDVPVGATVTTRDTLRHATLSPVAVRISLMAWTGLSRDR